MTVEGPHMFSLIMVRWPRLNSERCGSKILRFLSHFAAQKSSSRSSLTHSHSHSHTHTSAGSNVITSREM